MLRRCSGDFEGASVSIPIMIANSSEVGGVQSDWQYGVSLITTNIIYTTVSFGEKFETIKKYIIFGL